MASVFRRGIHRLRSYLPLPQVPGLSQYVERVRGKAGLEIGGPSTSFSAGNVIPVYAQVGSLDNCDFSASTVWGSHESNFRFAEDKAPGRSYFCEGSQLTPVADASYDFVLSSHNLEHFANPLRALYEWKRVLRPGGALILILPYYKDTFDQYRKVTPVENMLQDYRNGVNEDDLSHLDEILRDHDLSRDLPAGTAEEFAQRSRDNFANRCLHHHVFDEENLSALLGTAGYKVLRVSVVHPLHLCLLATI